MHIYDFEIAQIDKFLTTFTHPLDLLNIKQNIVTSQNFRGLIGTVRKMGLGFLDSTLSGKVKHFVVLCIVALPWE